MEVQGKLRSWGLLRDLAVEKQIDTIDQIIEYAKNNEGIEGLNGFSTRLAQALRHYSRQDKEGKLKKEVSSALAYLTRYSKPEIDFFATIEIALEYQRSNGSLSGFQRDNLKEFIRFRALKKKHREKKLGTKLEAALEDSGLLTEDTRLARTLRIQRQTLVKLEAYIKATGSLKGLKKCNLPLYDKFAVLKKLYRSRKLNLATLSLISNSTLLSTSDFELVRRKTSTKSSTSK